jgi:Holliday junction DNA helicase RuvA
MIVRLTGTVVDLNEESAVLERDGLAREVLIPRYVVGEISAVMGREITLHTMEFLESNGQSGPFVPQMIAFTHQEDKHFFRRFISVKGIGPRKALKALVEPVARIAGWIEEADVRSLTQLPGIGKRAAELIVAELRGKVAEFAMTSGDAPVAVSNRLTTAQRDALEVLLAWGEPRADAERWVERAAQLHSDINTPDEWIRVAYKIKTGAEG